MTPLIATSTSTSTATATATEIPAITMVSKKITQYIEIMITVLCLQYLVQSGEVRVEHIS